MKRFSYLLTRIFILGLIVLAAWVSMDSLVKFAIVRNGQQMTGAKVEIGQVRTSLSAGRIFLQDVRIADPRNPMLNLVQADAAFVELDPQRLLHREIVIEHGTTHQIMFAAPRTQSGSLMTSVESPPDGPATPEFPIAASGLAGDPEQTARLAAIQWLDTLRIAPSTATGTFETAQVAAQLRENWPARFDEKKEQIKAVREEITTVRQILTTIGNNPLRDEVRYEEARAELVRLHDQIATLQYDMTDLEREALADRDRLINAKERDESRMVNPVLPQRFNGPKLSEVLLTSQQQQHIEDIVEWFRWFRMTVPDPSRDFQPARGRGLDIRFAGAESRPQFLIRNLELDGEGQFAGQHFSFSGIARNITPSPALHDQPVKIELRAQGKQHLIVDCTLDRRGSEDLDTLYISSPDIEVDPVTLGHPQALVVSMGDARMQVDVSLQIKGDELSGDVIFRYSDVALFVERLHDLAGGEDTLLRLNQELAAVDRYQTMVSLGGTLEQPQFTFQSDLGSQFAGTMNTVAADQVRVNSTSRMHELDEILSREIEMLDAVIRRNIDDMSAILLSEGEIIAELQRAATQGVDRTRIR